MNTLQAEPFLTVHMYMRHKAKGLKKEIKEALLTGGLMYGEFHFQLVDEICSYHCWNNLHLKLKIVVTKLQSKLLFTGLVCNGNIFLFASIS